MNLPQDACNNPTCTYHADCRVWRRREKAAAAGIEEHCPCRECLKNGCAKGHCPRTQSCQLRYRDTVKTLQVVIAEHNTDADCDRSGLVIDGDCTGCGVTAGDPCLDCGGRRYHGPSCAAVERGQG
jgi:hypothetical protein